MSSIFWKNFQLCSFFNFKCLPTIQSPPPQPNDDEDHHIHSSSTSLLKNFNSLYHDFTTTTASTSKSSTTDDFFSSSSDDSSDSDHHQSPPDFAAVFASQRFFFSSPGSSNSIVESPDTKTDDNSDTTTMMDDSTTGGVMVRKYSVNPYDDFRRSMQEMLEARDVLVDERSDLEYLHELLLCYLALNPIHAHKFIISAFTDLVINLLSSPETTRHHPEIKIRRPDDILRRHAGGVT